MVGFRSLWTDLASVGGSSACGRICAHVGGLFHVGGSKSLWWIQITVVRSRSLWADFIQLVLVDLAHVAESSSGGCTTFLSNRHHYMYICCFVHIQYIKISYFGTMFVLSKLFFDNVWLGNLQFNYFFVSTHGHCNRCSFKGHSGQE